MWWNSFNYGRDLYGALYEQGKEFAVYPAFWFDAGWCDETKFLFFWGHLAFQDFFSAAPTTNDWHTSSQPSTGAGAIPQFSSNRRQHSTLDVTSEEDDSSRVSSSVTKELSLEDAEILKPLGWPHAFAYHWHNQWNALVEDRSAFAVLERVMYARIRMRLPE